MTTASTSPPISDLNLADLLQKDYDGASLKEMVNGLMEFEGQIRSHINTGLSKEEFEAQQALLEACKLATGYIQKFWQLKHKH